MEQQIKDNVYDETLSEQEKEKAADDEPFDEKMKRLTTELGGMFAKSHELEEEIKKNLAGIGWKI